MFERQLLVGWYDGSTYCTFGETSDNTPLDPMHCCGMLDAFRSYALQSGVGTAAPMQEIRSSPSARPVLTDGAAEQRRVDQIAELADAGAQDLPFPSCQFTPSRGLTASVCSARCRFGCRDAEASAGFGGGVFVNAFPSTRAP